MIIITDQVLILGSTSPGDRCNEYYTAGTCEGPEGSEEKCKDGLEKLTTGPFSPLREEVWAFCDYNIEPEAKPEEAYYCYYCFDPKTEPQENYYETDGEEEDIDP